VADREAVVTTRPPRRAWRWIPVAIAAVAALVELSCMGGVYFHDTTSFLTAAAAARGAIRFNLVNPGYPFLLELLCGSVPAAARMPALVVIQQLAIVVVPWLVLRAGEAVGRPTAGFVASLATSLYAPLSLFAHVALSDSLFAACFVATACGLCEAVGAPGRVPARRATTWVVSGVLAALTIALRSSGVALVAAAAVAALLTRPRAHLGGLVLFAVGFAATLGLVLARNHARFESWRLVQGGGIHLFCRVAVTDGVVADTADARELASVAQRHGLDSLLVEQSGWTLHALLRRDGRSDEEADALLEKVAWQTLAEQPWRSVRNTWRSMAQAVARVDPLLYVLDGTLRPARFAAWDADPKLAAGHAPDHFKRMRSLLPPYAPIAADDDPRFDWIESWSRRSRAWCGEWLLWALLAIGLLGLVRRDTALVLLAGAPFAQLAASAIGDRPSPVHFDPAAPVAMLAITVAVCSVISRRRADVA
jgi:hypothetical protein